MAVKLHNPTIKEIKKELHKRYNEFKSRIIRDGEVFINSKGDFVDAENVNLMNEKIESHHEIIDKMIESDKNCINMLSKACEYMGEYKSYSITNYAVLCENKIVCFTGSDVMDADNLCDFLEKNFPNKKFYISQEFPSIE